MTTTPDVLAAVRKRTGFACVQTPQDIDALEWHDMDGYPDVSYKLLWEAGFSRAGLLRVPAGVDMAPHAHEQGHHHVWVLDGSCTILDREVSAGSYVHIPGGLDHGVTKVGPDGCTMLYLYVAERA
jgi:quercetin dioxygenase-like cupin family protein